MSRLRRKDVKLIRCDNCTGTGLVGGTICLLCNSLGWRAVRRVAKPPPATTCGKPIPGSTFRCVLPPTHNGACDEIPF